MPKPGEISYCPELGGKATNAAFVWIPPGSFWMGDKREPPNPVHLVILTKGFWLQRTPLTERQYSNKGSDMSQVNISWDNVIDFCKDKPLRMLTEPEWEYAARSNTGHKYLWAGSSVVNNVAWTDKNSQGKPHIGGQLKANSYGLFDMSGNVGEWCSDWYADASPTPQVNPTGPASGRSRMFRGCCWRYDPQCARVAFRNSAAPGYYDAILSVRLIWEPQHA